MEREEGGRLFVPRRWEVGGFMGAWTVCIRNDKGERIKNPSR